MWLRVAHDMTQGLISTELLSEDSLQSAIDDLNRKLRCLQRAVAIMFVLSGLSMAGLMYCTVLLPDFPNSLAQFLMQSAVRCCCILGLASLLCLMAFSTLHLLYRNEFERKRELRRLHLIGVSIHA
jgi:hypothetical protein